MNLKKLTLVAVTSAVLLTAAGCGGSDTAKKDGKSATGSKITGSVTISGSSALLPLAKDAAAKFKMKNPEVSITLNGGGLGTGLKQGAEGTVNI